MSEANSSSRVFAPTKAFADNAIAKPNLYEQAKGNRLEFWAEQARFLDWQ